MLGMMDSIGTKPRLGSVSFVDAINITNLARFVTV